MNLPGDTEYDPTLPWVSKVRDEDGNISADFCSFVDDARVTAPTKEEAWKAAGKIAGTLSHLGL